MAIKIFAAGCRHMTDTNGVEVRHCDQRFAQNACELEPRVRELTELIRSQWTQTSAVRPPQEVAVLYLEYPSAKPFGTVHYGHYVAHQRQFIEQGSGEVLPEELVMAWMPIPAPPAGIYDEPRFRKPYSYDVNGDYPALD
jgi:hypothetical protein